MGQEISRTEFLDTDFSEFKERLSEETLLLENYLQTGQFASEPYKIGFELEAWLIDQCGYPAPINEAYLQALEHHLVTPELSRFNVELNGTPQLLCGSAFRSIEKELYQTWYVCQNVAREMDAALLMIGILPTITEAELCVGNISPLNRYYALNEQVMRQRRGLPLKIDIEGSERLATTHQDVMLEAATTSFQIHIQVPASLATRYYNASLLVSALMVAVSANSPLLFGKLLWDETRIPLFEQAVDLSHGSKRVSFGSGYLDGSVSQYFYENLVHYPILLPMKFESQANKFCHVRLQNGTIWRWNRLLIGFNEDNTPHFRIEHRVIPSGPTIIDQLANACLYVGLTQYFTNQIEDFEQALPFQTAESNFYQAAKSGLDSEVTWLNHQATDIHSLLLDKLLPLAEQGLLQLNIEADDSKRYLEIIRHRLEKRQTGAAWQRAFIAKYGRDFHLLTATYFEWQRSGIPVHEWDV